MIAAIRAALVLVLIGSAPLAAISSSSSVTAASVSVRPSPAPDSPVATDGPNVYAVSADRQTLLMTRPGRSDWDVLMTVPGADIRGLAWANDHLFFSNAADASLQFVSTIDRARRPTVVHRGSPFVRPAELTHSGSLIVTDPGAEALFRVALEKTSSGYRPISAPERLQAEVKITRGTFLAAWGSGEVMISDGESGFLGQLTEFAAGGSGKLRTMQTKESGSDAPVAWNQRTSHIETVRRKGYPGVHAPGPIATYNGILYVIDQESGELFAAGIHDARPIRIPMPVQGARINRLIANPVNVTALDTTGRLHTWPRVVPSELRVLPAARPQSLFPVLQYLAQRKLIATRPVIVSGTLDDTLEGARMSWPARGEQLEPETPQGKYASFCLFNPPLCTNGLPNRELKQGETIALASLYAERFTTATLVTLKDGQTLGQVVDEAIKSPEFKNLTTDAHLRRANGLREGADAPSPRELTTGTYRIALEQARYVIPIEVSELRPKTEYQRLRERVKDTLRIAPLERIFTKSAAAKVNDQGPDTSAALAQTALTSLLQAINYAPVIGVRTVYVGVAEAMIDIRHRDFVDPNGVEVLVDFGRDRLGSESPAPTPAGAAPSSSSPCPETAPAQPQPQPPGNAGAAAPAGQPSINWRAYHDCDHGTAIASIIGGRTRAYSDRTGFTTAIIGMLSRPRYTDVLAYDIEATLKEVPMTVVNLSLESQQPSERLRLAIEEQKTALFVISAPNSNGPVTLCKGKADWYPACYGKRFSNVLVVGGTTLDAKNLYARSPVGPDVHLFAPGDHLYAAGRNNSYVEVSGTSFATALVSAAAAMLSSAGETSPELIKQRLISTARVLPLPDRPQWARVLDVKKAVTYIHQSVFVDMGTRTEKPVTVVNRDDTLRFTTLDNDTLTPTIRNIRRLKRVEGDSNKYDLAYIEAGTRQLVLHTVKAPRSINDEERQKCRAGVKPCELWEVKFFPLNAQGGPAGPQATMDLTELFDYVGPIQFQ